MYNPDTEVLFPLRVIPTLGALHGDEWRNLVDHVSSSDASLAEQSAFVLMMVRLCGCVGCNADSFRAMRGCTQCARQAARRYRGGDVEIVEQYRLVLKEVDAFILKNSDGTAENK